MLSAAVVDDELLSAVLVIAPNTRVSLFVVS